MSEVAGSIYAKTLAPLSASRTRSTVKPQSRPVIYSSYLVKSHPPPISSPHSMTEPSDDTQQSNDSDILIDFRPHRCYDFA